jgi:hypothetical protein
MNRDLWIRSFPSDKMPAFPCPRCNAGSLRLLDNGLRYEETGYSKATHGKLGWEPDFETQRFTAFLQCSHDPCGEIVVMAGGVDIVDEYIEEVNAWGMGNALRPEVCFPAPPLIAIPKKTPESVKEPLLKAFQLFWSDASASANKIRVSAEALLTHFGVPRFNQAKLGRRRTLLNLNTRIGRFGKMMNGGSATSSMNKHPHETLLHALREVGNVGSHEGNVDEQVLLDAFEIYEYVLQQLIDKRPAAVAELAKALIKFKGNRGKAQG